MAIAAPADPNHLGGKLSRARDEAASKGNAEVAIGGRTFTLTKQFFDDLEASSVAEDIANLNKALLVMHSPRDKTVDIENAARIFEAARHPKSFVSLDEANHLMLEREDAFYAGSVIAAWVASYV